MQIRQIVIATLLLFFGLRANAQQIFYEDFEGEGIGATTGTAVGGTWSTTYSGSGSFAKQLDLAYGNVFRGANLDGEAIWQSNAVAATGLVGINIASISTGNSIGAGDYIQFYYKIDGGSEVLFYQLTSAAAGVQAKSTLLTVTSSIQVIAKVNNGDPIDLTLNDDRFVFDNVTITQVQTLYSRADNVSWSTSSSWSTTSHAGASCSCTPNEYTSVIIGDNDRINLTANQDVYSVYVANTGILRYTASNIALNLKYGGGFTVENGASYISNSQTGVRLDFESENDYTLTNDGTFSISSIQVNAANNLTVAGSGSFTLSGNFDLNNGSNLTFSTSGAVSIGATLDINVDGANSYTVTFNNSSTVTIPLIDIGAATTINFNNSVAVNITNDINIDEDATINLNNAVAVSVTDDLIIVSGDALTINGTGTLNVGDDVTLDDNLTKNGSGTLAVVDRLYFANSDILNVNAGTITSSSIFFNDDNAAINNISIITTGDILSNGIFADDNTITNNNGATLTFANLDGAATGSTGDGTDGGELNINNSGTINQSGNFLDISFLSDMNNLATGIWNWSLVANSGYNSNMNDQTVLDLTAVGNTFNFTGGTGTQTMLDNEYYHVGLSGTDAGGTNVVKQFPIGAAPIINGNLTISEEAQFDINTNNTSITLGGNFTMTGTNPDPFLDGDGTGSEQITFNGSGDQTITSPAAGEKIQRMQVNKTSGDVILVNNLTIRASSGVPTELTLTKGRIITSASSLLIFEDNAVSSGGDSDSYVDGPVRKDGNDAFVFPVGDGTVFARIAITAPGSTQTFTAEYFNDKYAADTTTDNVIHHISAYEYWSLTSTGGTAQVKLYWESSTNSEIDFTSDLRIAWYDGTDWVDMGDVTTTGGTFGTIQMDSPTSSFGLFTFASETGINPLPITLTSFTVEVKGNNVVTEWVTSMEVNNDFFTIEKSVDGETFSTVAKVKGKGNSKVENRYSSIDEYPYIGRSYYRLKQTDFDGKIGYSRLQVIYYDGPSESGIRIYPNPSLGKPVTLELIGFTSKTVIPIEIFNEKGQKVLELELHPAEGETSMLLPLQTKLPSGIYLVRAAGNYRLTRKIIID
jgi:hypothetical protein